VARTNGHRHTILSKINRVFPVYFAFAAFAVAAIIIGSWAPFQWHSAETSAVWQQFLQQGVFGEFSRSDVVVNFWLGFPVVLGLSGLARPHVGSITRRFSWAFLIFIVQACLSLLVEVGQGWFAPRVPSVSDFAIQLSGAAVATFFWQWHGSWIESQVQLVFARPTSDLKWTRLDAALTLIVLGILLWTVMPFDVIVSPVELVRESLQTEFVPFTRFEGSFGENVYQWLASFLLAVPLGLWLSRWLATHYNGKFSFITVILLAMVAGVLPEACQLPIDSRVASATDALFGTLGALAGLLLGSQFQSTRFQLAKTSFREMLLAPGFWFTLAILQVLIICAIAWMPFDFSTHPSEIAQRFKAFQSVPFSGYRGSDILNVLTLFRQAMLAATLGVFLGLGYRFLRLKYPFSLLVGTMIVLFVFVFSMGVEFGQLVVDSRTGESIGIFIRSAGSTLGLIMAMAFSRQSETIVSK